MPLLLPSFLDFNLSLRSFLHLSLLLDSCANPRHTQLRESMRAYEASATITRDGNLALPESVRKQLPAGQIARVIVLIPDSDEGHDWERLSAEQFLAGYAEADAVYDRPAK
jgi:hypothetical protein